MTRRGWLGTTLFAATLQAICGAISPSIAAEAAIHDHGAVHHGHDMPGVLGSYPMSREASGTSWQPDSTPHHMRHWMLGEWTVGAHLMAHLVYDYQGGDFGDEDFFSSNMLMLMGRRPLGPATVGVRAMFSAEPATIGKQGYPLLLQTGETADGRTPLVDRQHPHDLFMELAVMSGVPIWGDWSVFGYFGLPGEPALGPPAFMHRLSGMDNPEAPISHHWLDSTHVSFGVATAGLAWRDWKIEGSVFTGREPDEDRYDIEEPKFDSYSGRIAWNPAAASWDPDGNWSLQASGGHLERPEQLHPFTDKRRLTASITYNRSFDRDDWQTTFAWGQNHNTTPNASKLFNKTLNAFLLESALVVEGTHTLFCRGERIEVDELFKVTSPLHGVEFVAGKISLGYIYDVLRAELFTAGIGAVGSVIILPSGLLRDAYGEAPLSGMFFVRVKAG